MTPSTMRFFIVLLRPSGAIVCTAAAIVAVAAWLGSSAAGDFDQSFALVLLLQMFGAATGFTHAARRGHYDPVLCGPQSRLPAAAAHAAGSMLPGIVAWLGVICVDQVTRPRHLSTGLSVSAIEALLWISVVAWCLTLRLPRYSGGLLWLFVFVGLGSLHRLQGLEPILLDQSSWPAIGKAIAAALTAPLLLVAHPESSDPPLLLAVAAASLVVFGVGVWTILSLDIPLTEPS
jgi:hypothetical protein